MKIMPNTKYGFGSTGLVIVILVIIAGGAYLWSQKSALTNVSSGTTAVNTTGWETYSNSYPYDWANYNIKYPYDWVLNSSKATPTNEYEGSTITLVKENHKIEISIPSAFSPSVCLFEGDSPYTTKGEASTIRITGDYIEVKSSLNTFRRPVNPKSDGRTNERGFILCQKEKDSNFFQTSNISFRVPINYNRNLVSQMDEILKTFEDK